MAVVAALKQRTRGIVVVCSGISWKSEFLIFQSEVLFAFSGVLPPVRFATQNVGASTEQQFKLNKSTQIPFFLFSFPLFWLCNWNLRVTSLQSSFLFLTLQLFITLTLVTCVVSLSSASNKKSLCRPDRISLLCLRQKYFDTFESISLMTVSKTVLFYSE